MIISSDIKNIIQSFPEGRVFSISDFAIDPQYDMALAKLLSRWAVVQHKLDKELPQMLSSSNEIVAFCMNYV